MWFSIRIAVSQGGSRIRVHHGQVLAGRRRREEVPPTRRIRYASGPLSCHLWCTPDREGTNRFSSRSCGVTAVISPCVLASSVRSGGIPRLSSVDSAGGRSENAHRRADVRPMVSLRPAWIRVRPAGKGSAIKHASKFHQRFVSQHFPLSV